MGKSLVRAVFFVAALTALSASNAFAAPCRMGRVAELQIDWVNNRPLVPVVINGQAMRALVDTGATDTALFRSGADRLGLDYSVVPGSTIRGMGGASRLYRTRIDEVSFAGQNADSMRLKVLDHVWRGPEDVVMGLGQNVLARHDLEVDFAGGRITFFETRGNCRNTALAYWPEQWSAGPMLRRTVVGSPRMEVRVNGRLLRAMFDTGARTSLVTLDAARRVGVTPESEGVTVIGTSGGVGGRRLSTWMGRFETFQIGEEFVLNPRFRIIDTDMPGANRMNYDMIIGADFFRSHRVLFAYSQQRIYIAHVGGRVFQQVGPLERVTTDARAERAETPAN